MRVLIIFAENVSSFVSVVVGVGNLVYWFVLLPCARNSKSIATLPSGAVTVPPRSCTQSLAPGYRVIVEGQTSNAKSGDRRYLKTFCKI